MRISKIFKKILLVCTYGTRLYSVLLNFFKFTPLVAGHGPQWESPLQESSTQLTMKTKTREKNSFEETDRACVATLPKVYRGKYILCWKHFTNFTNTSLDINVCKSLFFSFVDKENEDQVKYNINFTA